MDAENARPMLTAPTTLAPKKSCKHCYGRGVVGHQVDSRSGGMIPVPCRCVKPKK